MHVAPNDIQSDTIAFLSSPEAHGGAIPLRIETHLSHLFLTRDHVLKLKKSVRFDFVDYSTASQRKTYCEREIAVNTDWAGSLYQGVDPIWRLAGRMGLREPVPHGAETLDWVVRMHRFSDEARGDRMLEAGKLDPSLLDGFADDLARRHDQAPPKRVMDGANRVGTIISQVGGDLSDCVPAHFKPQARSWTEAAMDGLQGLADLADARGRDGFVRACHGDLHLKNLVCWRGRLIGFDALEFDDALTTIDTLYDAAFPVMDLIHYGRTDLANLCLNRYLGMRGDYGGLALLPIFLSMRAAIRALAAAMANDMDVALPYLALAGQVLHTNKKPCLIALGGRSGTGKSTLARALAPEFAPLPGAIVIRSDVLRKRRTNTALDARLPSSEYEDEARLEVYRAMADRARDVLQAGFACVLDATFLPTDAAILIQGMSRTLGVPVHKVWLEAPDEVLRARISARQGDASDADLAVLEHQLCQPAPAGWLRVDVSGSPAEALASLRGHLSIQAGHIARRPSSERA